MKKLPMILGIILVIAFFLPWAGAGIMSISGFQIHKALGFIKDMADMANAFGGPGAEKIEIPAYASLIYLAYLIPILGGLLAFFSFKESSTAKPTCLAAGILTTLFFLVGMIGGAPLSALAIGGWLTFLAGIGCIVSFFIAFKE